MKIHLQSGLQVKTDVFFALAELCVDKELEGDNFITRATIEIGRTGADWVIEAHSNGKNLTTRRL